MSTDPSDYTPALFIIAGTIVLSMLFSTCAAVPGGGIHSGGEARECAAACGEPAITKKDGLCGCLVWKAPLTGHVEKP